MIFLSEGDQNMTLGPEATSEETECNLKQCSDIDDTVLMNSYILLHSMEKVL